MELSPVTVSQVQTGRDNLTYEVTGSAGAVVKQIQELDPRFVVDYNEAGGHFTVFTREGEDEHLVLRVRADEWDGRVVAHLAPRAHEVRNGISAAARLDAHDAAHKAHVLHEVEQHAGGKAYDLMRLLQRDVIGINPRSYRKVAA